MKFSYSLLKKLLPTVPKKTKLIEVLNMHSFETEDAGGDVLEISLPPNRYSDAASHIGIAREAAAILSLKFKNPIRAIVNLPADLGLLNIKIQDAKICPRYSARCFQIKDIKASPRWMQDFLSACGLKPIGNVVDIMNYVMLETGQPLHAFDYEKIGGRKIIVRKARKKEKIKTLDGQSFSLDQSVLVIADKTIPLAIAGIKGGLASGVGPKTKRIVVEAANFDPTTIFKTARKLKLQTDAVLRFSHGLSPALVDWGLDRATKLLLDAGARLLDSADAYPQPVGEEVIGFDQLRYAALIGANVKIDEARKFFQALGFSIDEPKNPPGTRLAKGGKSQKLLVRIPAWRTDVEEAEDLIEEVVRLKGYNSLRPVSPVVSVKPAREEDFIILKDRVRISLKNLQLDEVYNSSFVGEADARGRESGLVELENPIAEDKKYLRPSLLPLLLKNIEDNARFFDRVRIFEVGKIFSSMKSVPKERLSLGIALAEKDNHRLILELKGIVDELLKSLGVDDFSFVAAGEKIRIEVDHKVLGSLAQINLEKRFVAALGEFDLEATLAFTEDAKEYVPLKRFPAVLRDISVVVGSDQRIDEVLQEIQDANRKLIENVDLVDEYTDEKLGGRRSLTFRIIFQAEERTLTDEEVNREMEKIVAVLSGKFKAEIR